MKQLLLIILTLCFGTVIFAQADLQPAAIVNLIRSEPITVKQLRTEMDRYEKSGQKKDRREVLDLMINERLAIQAAERDKLTITENEVNKQVEQLKLQMAQSMRKEPTETEFAAAIKRETGYDLPVFRDQIRRQLIVQKYLMSKKQSLFDNAKPPTDSEIVSYYNLVKTQLVRPDTVRFSMIQVLYGQDAAAKTRAKELADRLFREISSNPSKFDEVALRAQSPNSGYQAGDGGYLPRNLEASQVAGQEFINTAFSLKQGEVSRVIEGRTGYQIIKVTETYTQKNLELDDIFQLGTRMTVRDYIGGGLAQEKQMQVLKQATDELVAELRAGKSFQIFENNLRW
jgi:parvulin-like peptidyl-prolyl isomerase